MILAGSVCCVRLAVGINEMSLAASTTATAIVSTGGASVSNA
jgi:hypothetical protein